MQFIVKTRVTRGYPLQNGKSFHYKAGTILCSNHVHADCLASSLNSMPDVLDGEGETKTHARVLVRVYIQGHGSIDIDPNDMADVASAFAGYADLLK